MNIGIDNKEDIFLNYDELCVLTDTDHQTSNKQRLDAYLKEELKQDLGAISVS